DPCGKGGRMAKIIAQILLFILPWPLRRRVLNAAFGYDIAPTARIGLSVIVVKSCRMADGAFIGHLTMVKGLRRLDIDSHGRLGKLNWVTGLPLADKRHFRDEPDRDPSLLIGPHAAITNRHIIDCTNTVTLGAYSTLGGFCSQILTHSIDFRDNRQSSRPVSIGQYCFVGTGAILLKGAVLPDRSILAAGAVLARAMTETGTL